MILQQQLDEEKEERRLVQQELERTTQRVAAMLDSMERVEKEFHTRGDSLFSYSVGEQLANIGAYDLRFTSKWMDHQLCAQLASNDFYFICHKLYRNNWRCRTQP